MEKSIRIYYLNMVMLIQVKDKKIINAQEYLDFFLSLNDWEYEIKPYKRTRSNDQNRYYRLLLSIVEKETGISVEETHEKMRMKFLFVPESWTQLAYCKSTAKLKTNEFWEYIENVKNFMAQFWIILPEATKYENWF